MPHSKIVPAIGADAGIVRDRLLAAACEEFCRSPFADTDVDKIAARADLSAQMFYEYFRDKIEIFTAAVEYLHRQEAGEIAARLEAASAAGANASGIVDVIFSCLLASRRRQALFRLQCSILRRSDPRILEAVRRAQSDYAVELMRAFGGYTSVRAGSVDCRLDLCILSSLLDAIANDDFEETYRARVEAEVKSILSAFFRSG